MIIVKQEFGKLEALLGLGAISPLPIIGELYMTGLLYRTMQDVPIVKEHKASAFAALLITSTLARSQIYSGIYRDIANYISK